MLEALGFVAHDNTFMCAIVDSKAYEAMAKENEAKLDSIMIEASGWYLEY